MGMIESATSILVNSDRQLEIVAQNVSNMTSPGYRARQSFVALTVGAQAEPTVASATDFAIGKVDITDNPYDFALGANGFFVVRAGEEGLRYTRNGQFSRDAGGRLVTSNGWALQSDAGDLVLRSQNITVSSDGTVMDDGQPVARIAIKDFDNPVQLIPAGGSSFLSPQGEGREVLQPDIRQGALESGNVSSAQEMINMMRALRNAETGQRLIQVYDDLLGKAINSFGQVQV